MSFIINGKIKVDVVVRCALLNCCHKRKRIINGKNNCQKTRHIQMSDKKDLWERDSRSRTKYSGNDMMRACFSLEGSLQGYIYKIGQNSGV